MLEDKNQMLIGKCYIKGIMKRKVIIVLKKVIDDKEKMINNSHTDYSQLNIKYEDAIKQRDLINQEIESFNKETTKHCNNCNCNSQSSSNNTKYTLIK
jgi:hypothetical protein